MMLWPPIFTTLTHGRMAKSDVASVARMTAVSVRDPPTNWWPSAFRMTFLSMVFICLCLLSFFFFSEFKNIEFKGMLLTKHSVERLELSSGPGDQLVQCRSLNFHGQSGKLRSGAVALQELCRSAVHFPLSGDMVDMATGLGLQPVQRS